VSFSIKNSGGEVSGDFSKLEKLIENLDKNYYVDIGILGESNETLEGNITLAGIGAVHEFGTDRAGRGNKTVIPERSFIREPLETGQEQIESEVNKNFKKNVGEGNIKQIFTDIGIAGEARIQEAFETEGFGEWEPNAESTIARKKSDSPLIDTGAMRRAITSKVGGGE
jgi:phage gpG-like protein